MKSTGAWKRRMPCPWPSVTSTNRGLFPWACSPRPTVCPACARGWIASQERDAIGALSRYKNYLSICCPTPSEALARIALKHGPAILARNREIIARNRHIAADFFAPLRQRLPATTRPRPGPSPSTACGRTS